MSGFVGDSGDTWGHCPVSPTWTLTDKALTPLGTQDRRAGRQTRKNVPAVPTVSGVRRVLSRPLRQCACMTLITKGLGHGFRGQQSRSRPQLSPIWVPMAAREGNRSRMPRRTWAVGAQQSYAPTVKRRRATLRSPHAAPSCIAPPSAKVGPRSREAGRLRQLLTDHAVVIGIPHERVGRMIPAHRRNAVPPRLMARDSAVVVVECKRVPTAHTAPLSSARRFR